MGIHISSFCVEKEQGKMIQWSLNDNRLKVFRVRKKLNKLGMSIIKLKGDIYYFSQLENQGHRMKLCNGICFGSTEHNRKNSASSSESPEPFLTRNEGGYQARHQGGPWLLHSKNPLLACTGRLEIRVHKPLFWFKKAILQWVFNLVFFV